MAGCISAWLNCARSAHSWSFGAFDPTSKPCFPIPFTFQPTPSRGLALDPVANFHLRNGASVLRLNWRGDTSAAGLSRSHGLMVNYQYELDRLADNNRAYLVSSVVGASPGVRALLREADGG